ncbi:MAG: zinc-binding dehydrogenase [Saprospiraceae bacterium]|nr:zinc-binding dehydrogenase [Saprospiraceae bacterium]
MKALVLKKENSFPVLSEVDRPKAPESHVILETRAAALNRRDYWICKGKYPKIEYPVILGSDVCGLLEGESMIVNPGFEWGDDERVQSKKFNILGLPTDGALAEYVSVPKKAVYPKPSHLSEPQAAALPLAGVTAYRALFTRAGLKEGESLLVSGAGGGVASVAMQFGLAVGAEVYVTSGLDDKVGKAIELGAQGGVNYKREGWMDKLKEMSSGFDVIIDSAAGEGFKHLVKLMNPGGRIVFYGGTRGAIDALNPQFIFWRQLSIMGSTMGSPRDFEDMLKFVDQHKITPLVDRAYKFKEVDQAFERLSEYDQFGKIVMMP